jgi:hypothetical protein
MSIHQIEKWTHWLVAKPVAWAVFCGWLALGFCAAGIVHGGAWLIRRRAAAAKEC